MVTATFKSRNEAIKFLSVITKAGVAGKLISLDSGISEGGCSYGIRINRRWMGIAKSLGLKENVLPERWL